MPEFPDGTVAGSAPPSAAARKLSRWLLIVGYSLAVIIVLTIVAYHYAMRPSFLEPLIKKQFAAKTNGTIDLSIEQASLFRGFKFRNVVVKAPPGYAQTPLLKARELTVLYNFYGFFRGRFGVHEIGLRGVEIFAERRNNVLNLQALLKPGKKEDAEEEKEPGAEKKTISWFFDVQLFTRLVIEDFRFTYDARHASNRVREYAHLHDFNFSFSMLTRDFSRVDLTDKAGLVALLNALVIELNPQKKIDIAYEGPAGSIATPLQLSWLLFYDGQSRRPEFKSRMQIGQEKIPVVIGRGARQNLSFLADHSAEYDAKEDRFRIGSFNIRFLGDTLLSLTGDGEKVLTPGRVIRIQTGNSRVDLGKIHNLLTRLSGKNTMQLAGLFSIKPTRLQIEGNNIRDEGGLKLERVSFRQGATQLSLPVLDLDHAAQIDGKLKPLPLKQAKVKLRAVFNAAPLSFDAELAANRKTDVNFSLRGLNVASLSSGKAQGPVSTVFTASGDSPQNLAIALRVFSPQLFYYVDRGKSGMNRFDFALKGQVKSNDAFSQNQILLPQISFSNKDRDYQKAVELKSHLKLDRSENIHLIFGLDELTLYFKELIGTLPTALQESIGVQIKLLDPGRTMRIDGETAVTLADGQTAINHETYVAMPDAQVDDIEIKARARLSPPYTHIDHFSLTGLQDALSLSASGSLKNSTEIITDKVTGKPKRVAVTVPDVKYAFSLGKSAETEVRPKTFLSGNLNVAGTARGDTVSGRIKIDKLNVKSPMARINQVNLDFPFKHDLRLQKTLNLRAGNKERIIKNYNFNKPNNFTIQSIEIPDPNNSSEWLQILYSRGNYPAIGASMEYKDNVFIMPVMQLYTLNGVVTISDTMFNLGRFVPAEMEYSMAIQIKDIDLKQIMTREKADTITDGKLRIDMLFTGNHLDKVILGYRLDKFLENLSGYVSVYRIGPEFAQMVMRASNPKQSNMVSTLASSAAKPQRIDINIKEGFVYTHIPMSPGVVGRLLLSPKEINNDRINVPEFFQRISNEASIYTSASTAQAN